MEHQVCAGRGSKRSAFVCSNRLHHDYLRLVQLPAPFDQGRNRRERRESLPIGMEPEPRPSASRTCALYTIMPLGLSRPWGPLVDPLNPSSSSYFGPLKASRDGTRKLCALLRLCDWCREPGSGGVGWLLCSFCHRGHSWVRGTHRVARNLTRFFPRFRVLFESIG